MRYQEPRCALVQHGEDQDRLVDKFGGHPWGVPSDQWPSCRQCGRPQTHVAQLLHDDERLDLGGPGRSLTIFQCESADPCDTYDSKTGANALLIGDWRSGRGVTPPPMPTVPVLPEMRVVRWLSFDDGIDPERYDDFLRTDSYYRLGDLLDAVPLHTKAGGPPRWCQSAEDGPPPPWRFVLQLNEAQYGEGRPPTAAETGFHLTRTVRRPDGEFEFDVEGPPGEGSGDPLGFILVGAEGWSVGGPNFGMGTAYVFVNTSTDPATAMMFWQR